MGAASASVPAIDDVSHSKGGGERGREAQAKSSKVGEMFSSSGATGYVDLEDADLALPMPANEGFEGLDATFDPVFRVDFVLVEVVRALVLEEVAAALLTVDEGRTLVASTLATLGILDVAFLCIFATRC